RPVCPCSSDLESLILCARRPDQARARQPPARRQRRNGHHDRAAPAGPLTLTRTTEILSFPPASLAASTSALAASGSNSQLCNSWLIVSSSIMSERPSEHSR